MNALIDVEQLRTFVAIVETGSFTQAGEVVHKTQSAVSMQMKKLEERLGHPIFARDGRGSKLTEHGERLLDYARRIVKLNVEALTAFSDAELSGHVRLGVPDDYADRYLPEIMARFSRVYPGAELTVVCAPSIDLIAQIDGGTCEHFVAMTDAVHVVRWVLSQPAWHTLEVAHLAFEPVMSQATIAGHSFGPNPLPVF